METSTWQAPWSKALIVTSALVTVLLAGVAVWTLSMRMAPPAGTYLPWVSPLILLASLPFIIRSYSIDGKMLLIRRLFWITRVPLDDLESVSSVPDAMWGSLRLCGNGGLFSFTGFYRNKSLGIYRAFVTDQKKTVVLRFREKRVVISPENPEEFTGRLRAICGLEASTES